MAESYLLTKEGFDKIVAEHEELVSVRRHEVAERLKEAISYGDLSENAEYDSAKNEQAELEAKISKLEAMIKGAKIIDHDEASLDTLSLGLSVKVREQESGDEDDYTIVGSTEAKPFEGKLSNESDVGRQLLGSHVGDVVEVQIPDGIVHYEILKIYR